MTAQTQHWIVHAYQHANDKKFSMGYFDGTRAQATKYFVHKKNVNRYFRPGYTVTMEANPIILHDGYESNPSHRKKKKVTRKKNPVSKRYFLYDVLNDYSIAKVDGKSDFGTLDHAKDRAVKDNRGEKVLWSNADIPPRTHKHYYGRNKYNELIYLISTHGLLKNPKLRQKGNTKVTEGPGKQLVVRLHATDILQILANGDVQLDSGGWKTVTTKRRMNEAADELGLGFNVYAKKGEWFVESYEVGVIPFFDGMIFPATKKKNPKARVYEGKRKKKISSRDGYAVALISTGEFFWRGRGGWAAPPEPYTSFEKANAAVKRIAKDHGNLYALDDFEIHSVPLSVFKKRGTWTRKKNPKKLWMGFKIKGKDVRFLVNRGGKFGFSLTKGEAIPYATKKAAHDAISRASNAISPAWDIGVAPLGTEAHIIWNALNTPGK